MALYDAKAAGRGTFRRFVPALDEARRRKRELEQELPAAIENGELELHYQPIVDARSRQVVSLEALVRWRHPRKGLVQPDDFISIAEETGLIVALGDWVLRQACRDAQSWPSHIRLAVNFSAKQFTLNPTLADSIRRTVAEEGLEPGRLEVEITETTLMEAQDALTQLRAISDGGIRISLDDFGTGYSSLSYLRKFPVDKVKIDRSFARDMHEAPSRAVIGAVAHLARELRIELVMEGVETEEQLQALAAHDVHLIQGFLFSTPKPILEILPMLGRSLPQSKAALKVVA
jgi:EAL domain-containing protein (putative c-di-GMP-specific phosphodiesterase class I)